MIEGGVVDLVRRGLFREGEILFRHVVEDLNRIDVHGAHHSFRRQEDYEEICIALALYARKKGIQEGVNG